MHLRTELTIPPSNWKIAQDTRILTLGSCFAEVMGRQLHEAKLSVLNNPFGTIFNPVSIANLLEQSIDNQTIDENLFVNNQDVWFHYDVHSSFWGSTHEDCQSALQTQIIAVHGFLKTANLLIITLGTAFAYRHLATGKIVANCHKMPAHLFEKQLLTVSEIVESFQKLHEKLKIQRPKLKTILTVSPVRHTRDTLPLNQVSKATLRLACHELSQSLPNCGYFPSYEIMLDDLRDYRFYKPDLIHPNEIAEAHIFSQFAGSYFDNNLQLFVAEWGKIKQSLAHKPLQTGTAAHRLFLENVLKKLEKIGESTNVNAEILQIKAELAKFEGK